MLFFCLFGFPAGPAHPPSKPLVSRHMCNMITTTTTTIATNATTTTTATATQPEGEGWLSMMTARGVRNVHRRFWRAMSGGGKAGC